MKMLLLLLRVMVVCVVEGKKQGTLMKMKSTHGKIIFPNPNLTKEEEYLKMKSTHGKISFPNPNLTKEEEYLKMQSTHGKIGTLGGWTFGGRTYGGRTFGGRTFVGQPFVGQTFVGRTFGGRTFGGRTYAGRTYGGPAYGGRTYAGWTYAWRTHAGQTYTGRTYAGHLEGGHMQSFWTTNLTKEEEYLKMKSTKSSVTSANSLELPLGKIYQFNENGHIECKEVCLDLLNGFECNDCPPSWTDPNCGYIEDDKKQVYHCWQTEYEYYCGYDKNFPYKLICLEGGVESTNCYIDPVTGTKHERCGECLLGSSLSTEQFIQDTINFEKECKEVMLPNFRKAPGKVEILEEKDFCESYEGCFGGQSVSGGLPLTHALALAGQGTLRVGGSNKTCPQDTCQRKKKCCQLAYYAGVFMCPYYC